MNLERIIAASPDAAQLTADCQDAFCEGSPGANVLVILHQLGGSMLHPMSHAPGATPEETYFLAGARSVVALLALRSRPSIHPSDLPTINVTENTHGSTLPLRTNGRKKSTPGTAGV